MVSDCEYPTDFENNILKFDYHSLETLLEPRNIAVFGATHEVGTVGNTLLKNLLNSPFYGPIFPINAAGESVFDIKAYSHIEEIPDQIDLAVIATPISRVPSIIEDCAKAGVKNAIAISPGFRETGTLGRNLEKQLREKLSLGRMRLLGPNSLGVMNPRKGLNATLTGTMARPGNIGFISQSGALCRAVVDWSFHENVGFSAFISMGSMLDVDWGDLIHYLGADPYTQSIVIHMEAIGDVKSFLAAAREVALIKPIILLKGGRTEAAVKAAIAHTGGIMGSDDVFEAALRRCGILRVNRISELFNLSEVLAKRKFQPQGNRLTIITNSGGLGVLATDALVSTGGQPGNLAAATLAHLDEVLPTDWSRSNPIDILGDADSDRYQQAIEIAVRDPNTDGVLVILAPQGVADPTETAEKLKDIVNQLQTTPLKHKPILASWVGGAEVVAGETILNRHQIPTYPYPDSAARLFNLMWQHSYCLQGMYETPALPNQWDAGGPHRAQVEHLIRTVHQEGRTTLTPVETATLLSAYGLPMVTTRLATTETEAVEIANEMGYPVVLKRAVDWLEESASEPHRGTTPWHGASAAAVHHAYRALTAPPALSSTVILQPLIERAGAYELMMSSATDAQFGPVIRFGTGGWPADIYGDRAQAPRRHRAVALPPLNDTLAQRLIEQTLIYPALQGQQGYPAVDLKVLKLMLMQFGQLVVEQPWIREIQINPLLMHPEVPAAVGVTQTTPMAAILDARIVLHSASCDPASLPQPLLRPYPSHYVQSQILKDRTPVTLRPVCPTDEPRLIAFHQRLTETAQTEGYTRYPPLRHLSPHGASEQIMRLCFLDFDQEIALVAESPNTQTGLSQIIGVGRLSKLPAEKAGQFGLVVDGEYRDRGLDQALLQQLIDIGRQEGLPLLKAEVMNNPALSSLCEKAGFEMGRSETETTARLSLSATA
ncbi:MAG: GNAT family N-acetyltransferase [Leptolyngbya sp. SIO1E4]|nr:GNAT family N-acetyltransferase [Leptolyngbya sp. SIO1E4]